MFGPVVSGSESSGRAITNDPGRRNSTTFDVGVGARGVCCGGELVAVASVVVVVADVVIVSIALCIVVCCSPSGDED